MNAEETKKAIAVMQAYADGKTVEYKVYKGGVWAATVNPVWSWGLSDYRIKPEPRTLYTVISANGTVMYSDFDRDCAVQIQTKYGLSAIMESKEVL